MDKSKLVKRIVLLTLLTVIIAVIAYYTVEVLSAKAETPEIVDSYQEQIEITLDELTERQIEILLNVEDPNFYNHNGADFVTPGAGWTTITQGLAKRFYFEDFQQGFMKIKQTLCAVFALDPLVNKDTQLTLYINIMYFGNGVNGLNDAASFYFGKQVSELSEDEYISLIACLIDPEGLNLLDHPDQNAIRVSRIKKVLSGEYKPSGLFDITYEDANMIH